MTTLQQLAEMLENDLKKLDDYINTQTANQCLDNSYYTWEPFVELEPYSKNKENMSRLEKIKCINEAKNEFTLINSKVKKNEQERIEQENRELIRKLPYKENLKVNIPYQEGLKEYLSDNYFGYFYGNDYISIKVKNKEINVMKGFVRTKGEENIILYLNFSIFEQKFNRRRELRFSGYVGNADDGSYVLYVTGMSEL